MGGTLYHMSPMVAAAAMRFDARIALMPALYERALAFASELRRHPRLRVNPEVPQANMLHLHFDAPADAVMQARDALAEEAGCWLFDNVRPSTCRDGASPRSTSAIACWPSTTRASAPCSSACALLPAA